MTHDEAKKLKPGDTILFAGWNVERRGKVLSIYERSVGPRWNIRISWEDNWVGTYGFNNLNKMTKETSP